MWCLASHWSVTCPERPVHKGRIQCKGELKKRNHHDDEDGERKRQVARVYVRDAFERFFTAPEGLTWGEVVEGRRRLLGALAGEGRERWRG